MLAMAICGFDFYTVGSVPIHCRSTANTKMANDKDNNLKFVRAGTIMFGTIKFW